MTPSLLRWALAPDGRRGLHFAAGEGAGWETYSYERLAGLAAGAAREMVAGGLRRNGVAALLLPSGPTFAVALFGALLAGGTPCPLAPPGFLHGWDEYVDHAAGVLRAAGASLFVTDATLAATAAELARAAGLTAPPVTLELSETCDPSPRPPAEVALLQFTSGSSGRPRGVRVTHDNLASNVAVIRRWLDMGPGDGTATWLPPHHDMGLIGCLLTPAVNQSDVWVLRPDQFVRSPARWIERFGRGAAALTAAPNFGYAFAARRLAPAELEGMDFSGWRAAIVGAERIEAGALARFAAVLRPHGFRASAFRPAYGLAEATLTVTGLPLGAATRAARVRWDGLRFGQPVPVLEVREVDDPAIGDGDGWLVSSGPAHPGVALAIVDGAGERLPAGSLGEILVAGASVAAGYRRPAPEGTTAFTAGGLRTGDAGFLHAGELYVLGRIADSLKVRGQVVYAEHLEARLAALPGIPAGRCVVVAGPGPDGERVVAVVEQPPGPWVEEAHRLLARETAGAAVVQVLAARRGAIMRTSSGKPRRRVLWQALLSGELAPRLAGGDAAPPRRAG